jgi:serine/threonine protein kinase
VAAGEEPREELRDHLGACPKCQELLNQFKSDLGLLKGIVPKAGLPPLTTSGLTSEPVTSDGQTDHSGGTDNASEEAVEPTAVGASPSATDIGNDHEAGRSNGEPLPGPIGKYLVIGRFPPTGQAEVFRVVHPGLARDLVLKLALRPIEPGGRHELIDECKILAELEHPNLVRVYDLDFHDNRPYVVMEYIRGRTLEQVAEDGNLKPRQAAALLAKVAGAADFVHKRGIVHRDIKPKNILVDERGEPRLIDFGMARLRHAWSEDPGKPGGTFAFMSPEQARVEMPEEQQRVGSRSDVFSLGAVLYYLLTGKPPFEGRNWRESWDRARSCNFDRKALENPKVPRDLRRICLKAMAAEPADRYSSAAAFQKALENYVRVPIVRGTVAGVAGIALLSFLTYQIMARPPVKSSNVPPTPTTVAPLTGEMTLRVWSPGKEGKRGWKIGVETPQSMPVRRGEMIHIEAKVNQPAYVYLLWLDGQGKITPLYPWIEQDFSKLPAEMPVVSELHDPPELDKGWPVEGPSGLETILMLARRTPLPAGIDLTAETGTLPPAPLRDPLEVAVRGFDADQPVEAIDQGTNRGPGKEAKQIDEPLLQLLEKLRRQFECTRAVRFAYQEQ